MNQIKVYTRKNLEGDKINIEKLTTTCRLCVNLSSLRSNHQNSVRFARDLFENKSEKDIGERGRAGVGGDCLQTVMQIRLLLKKRRKEDLAGRN